MATNMATDLEITASELSDLPAFSKHGKFLSDCKIFLSGFSDFDRKWLTNIIISGGGVTLNEFNENVSHVVCGVEKDPLIKELKSSGTHVVSFHWLIDCCKNQKVVDERPFFLSSGENSPVKLQNKTTSKSSEYKVWKCWSKTTSMSKVFYSFLDGFSDAVKDLIPDKRGDLCEVYASELLFEEEIITNQETTFLLDGENSYLSFADETEEEGFREAELEKEGRWYPRNEENSDVFFHDETDSFRDAPSDFDSETSNLQLFVEMKFVLVGFGPKNFGILSKLVKLNAGTVCEEGTVGADVVVVPVVWNKEGINAKTIVTNCWLQKCVEDGKLLPFDDDPLFKPLTIKSSGKPLKKCVITITQHRGVIRNCLQYMAEKLGAVHQEYLVSGPLREEELLPTTHLIAIKPEGLKYNSAKQWNIPVVTKHWLIDAAKSGELPIPDLYLIREESDEDCISPTDGECPRVVSTPRAPEKSVIRGNVGDISPWRQRILRRYKRRRHSSLFSTVSDLAENAEVCNDSCVGNISNITLAEQFLNPDVQYHPDFDILTLQEFLDGSEDEDRERKLLQQATVPVEELFSRNLSLALEMFKTPDDIPEGTDLLDNLNEAGFLKGVKLRVSKILTAIQEELYAMVSSLGGRHCSSVFLCTHFVFRGIESDSNWEFRLARTGRKKIVSPEWLLACRDQGKLVDETLYPHTYNLCLASTDQKCAIRISSSEYETAPEGNENDSDDDDDDDDKQTEKSDICNRLDEIIKVMKTAKENAKNIRVLNSPSKCIPSVFGDTAFTSQVLKAHVDLLTSQTDSSRADEKEDFPRPAQCSRQESEDAEKAVAFGNQKDTRACRTEKKVQFKGIRFNSNADHRAQKASTYAQNAAQGTVTYRSRIRETLC